MSGLGMLTNLQLLVESVLVRQVPGDLLEAGVWRGGGSILMKAILESAHDEMSESEKAFRERKVWVVDSFTGVPPPTNASSFRNDVWHSVKDNLFSFSQAQVQRNFERFGLLDDRIKFVSGYFCDTLRSLSFESGLALVRIDADSYESVRDALNELYPKLSVGGWPLQTPSIKM